MSAKLQHPLEEIPHYMKRLRVHPVFISLVCLWQPEAWFAKTEFRIHACASQAVSTWYAISISFGLCIIMHAGLQLQQK